MLCSQSFLSHLIKLAALLFLPSSINHSIYNPASGFSSLTVFILIFYCFKFFTYDTAIIAIISYLMISNFSFYPFHISPAPFRIYTLVIPHNSIPIIKGEVLLSSPTSFLIQFLIYIRLFLLDDLHYSHTSHFPSTTCLLFYQEACDIHLKLNQVLDWLILLPDLANYLFL